MAMDSRYAAGPEEPAANEGIGRRGILQGVAAGLAVTAVGGIARAVAQPAAAAMPPGVTVLADGLGMPEGPIALDDGSVLVCEISNGRLTKVLPNGVKQTVAETGGGPNGAAIGPGGACFIANNGGYPTEVIEGKPVMQRDPFKAEPKGSIQRVNLASGEVQTVYKSAGDHQLLAPNDLVFGADGNFWFTDLGRLGDRAIRLGSLCWGRADGSECREIDHGLMTPNGIALSPDGRTLYVALSSDRKVLAYTVTGPGTVAMLPNGKPQSRVLASLGGDIALDSMAVEENGNIVVGTLIQGALTVLSPAGELVERVSFPGWVTNLDFGGPDRKTAYATMTPAGKLIQLAWPRPGLKLPWR